MNLQFYEVSAFEADKIDESYKIIKECGECMYRKQGLLHWKNPYPIESIRKDCLNRHVFVVKDQDSGEYVHTFQLEISRRINNDQTEETVAKLFKIATIPWASGKGIGMECMAFIEDFCLKQGALTLYLDVYDKSEHAIRFFKRLRFSIIDSRPTTYFSVYVMEKKLSVNHE